MSVYRDPFAAADVGVWLREKLTEAEISPKQFAEALNLPRKRATSLLTGRNYFPPDQTGTAAKLLGVSEYELTYLMLLQYFPEEVVENIFSVIENNTIVTANDHT